MFAFDQRLCPGHAFRIGAAGKDDVRGIAFAFGGAGGRIREVDFRREGEGQVADILAACAAEVFHVCRARAEDEIVAGQRAHEPRGHVNRIPGIVGQEIHGDDADLRAAPRVSAGEWRESGGEQHCRAGGCGLLKYFLTEGFDAGGPVTPKPPVELGHRARGAVSRFGVAEPEMDPFGQSRIAEVIAHVFLSGVTDEREHFMQRQPRKRGRFPRLLFRPNIRRFFRDRPGGLRDGRRDQKVSGWPSGASRPNRW